MNGWIRVGFWVGVGCVRVGFVYVELDMLLYDLIHRIMRELFCLELMCMDCRTWSKIYASE